MFNHSFEDSYKEREKNIKEWFEWYKRFEEQGEEHKYSDKVYSKANWNTYVDWAWEPASPPNPYRFMPTGEWYQLFETISEGTPLSPAFEKPQELVKWLTENKDYRGETWDSEQAKAMVSEWRTASGAMIDGKYMDSKELVVEQSKRKK